MEGAAAAALFCLANSFELTPEERAEALEAAAQTMRCLLELGDKLDDRTIIQAPAIGV